MMMMLPSVLELWLHSDVRVSAAPRIQLQHQAVLLARRELSCAPRQVLAAAHMQKLFAPQHNHAASVVSGCSTRTWEQVTPT